MAGSRKLHWEGVHGANVPDQASWWQAEPTRSLRLIEASGVGHADPIITDPDDREAYRATLAGALRPGGQAIISTFGLDGPERCSGLDVERYSAESLSAELGNAFELLESVDDVHRTPSGAEQAFIFCRFRRTNL